MKKGILLLLLVSAASFCHAQDELPTVVPDRPGFVWGAEVTPIHKVAWDNGFSFESMPDGTRSITLNSTSLRYGIFENVELRVGTDFVLYNDNATADMVFGVAPLTVGAKMKLYESSNFLPSVGILTELKSPHVGTKDLLPSRLAPALYLLFEHSIGERPCGGA